MSLFRRHRWFAAAAGVTLAFAVVSLTAPQSAGLTAFADFLGLLLMLLGIAACVANIFAQPKQERSFWILLTLGFGLWVTNQAAWTVQEVVFRRPVPDPFFFDIILFFHTVPMIAAVAWRPDQKKKEGKVLLSLLSFLMLMGWWLFLYAFIVFPHQYVAFNTTFYNSYYDHLYGFENIFLLVVLALSAWTSSGGWRKLYLHLFAANLLYSINSQLLDRAAAARTYYSGSLYDVALMGTLAWMAAAIWSSRQWNLQTVEFNLNRRMKKLVPQLAMLAILSLPVLGAWSVLYDNSAPPTKVFRLFTVLCAMLALGSFVFLRQYIQDQELIAVLGESRRAYDRQKQLQNQLVQKEKLASLGNLIAGAAREIDHPLQAIMNQSEQLWSTEKLTDEQTSLVRKIVNQARRTHDLVANLLSFAQQTPGAKIMVDLNVLLSRATQMLEARRGPGKIKIQLSVDPKCPHVAANANQLFQAFVEMIENAMDAIDEVGGGSLEITAQPQAGEVVLQFSDSGPGIRDPQRVFDPFYTTKPVGKGTGLGLSAVYGVVQDHGGQISCQNKPGGGGAIFTVRLPVTAAPAVQAATAAV